MDSLNIFSVFDDFAGGLIYSPPTAVGAESAPCIIQLYM